MKSIQTQNETIIRYLFAELSEPEMQQFEEQYFVDQELLLSLNETCDQVLSAYLTETLPLDQQQKLTQRLHACPLLKTRLLHLQKLRDIAEQELAESSSGLPITATKKRWLTINFNSSKFQIAFVACAILALTSIWLLSGRQQATKIAQNIPPSITPLATATPIVSSPTPSPEKQNLATPAATKPTKKTIDSPPIPTFLLSNEIVRGTETPLPITVPNNAEQMQLEIETPTSQTKSYQIKLLNADNEILQQWSAVKVATTAQLAYVKLNLTTKYIPAGIYQLRLASAQDDVASETPLVYFFQLVKK